MEQKKFKKVLIIYSDFYPVISKNLLKGATSFLEKKKIIFDKQRVVGSLEIPFLLYKYMDNYSGFIILGCVIKGETDHYNVVKDISFGEIYSLAYKKSLPLGTALLTVDNYEQAIERSDVKKKNIGEKAAIACCDLMKILKTKSK